MYEIKFIFSDLAFAAVTFVCLQDFGIGPSISKYSLGQSINKQPGPSLSPSLMISGLPE
jgi:hypothetical protein